MKRFFIRLTIILTVILVFFGGNWWLFKTGWWEKTLSTSVLPFELLRTKESQSLAGMAVKNEGNRAIGKLKEELTPFTSLFNPENQTRPDLSKSGFSNESIEKLNKLFDPIYGVDYQYIAHSSISGLIQTNKGWNPVLTLSVYDDTNLSHNYSYEVYKGSSGWELGDLINESQDEFSYPELDNNFNVSALDLSISQDDKFIKEKQWLKSTDLDNDVIELLKGGYQNVVTKVWVSEATASVIIYRSFNTPSGIKEIVREQKLDDVNTSNFTIKIN